MGERLADMRAAGNILGAVSTLLDQIDWDQLADHVSRAETVGPILMPTEYQACHERLAVNGRAIEATRTYLAELRKLAPQAVIS